MREPYHGMPEIWNAVRYLFGEILLMMSVMADGLCGQVETVGFHSVWTRFVQVKQGKTCLPVFQSGLEPTFLRLRAFQMVVTIAARGEAVRSIAEHYCP